MRIEDIIKRKIAEAEQNVTKLIKKEVEEQIEHDMIGARIYYEDRKAGEAWLRMHMKPKEENDV